jgi:hypothetical protein
MQSEFPFDRRRVSNIPEVVAHKWSHEVVDEGFVPFPKRLIRCLRRLFAEQGSVGDLQVILAVVDYARPNLTRPPSPEYLAFLAGMTVPLLKDHLQDMEQRGWITTEMKDGGVVVRLDGLLERIGQLSDDGSRMS